MRKFCAAGVAEDSILVRKTDTIHCINEQTCIPDTLIKDDNGGPAPNYSYYWNYGNGDFSNSPTPCFTYSTPGNYLIYVLISDSLNVKIDSISYSVFVPNCNIQTQRLASNVYKSKTHSGINIFPNPTSSILFIQLKSSEETIETIKFIDNLGQVIIDKKNKNGNSLELNNGMYFIKVITENKNVYFQKIVKY
jgi:hypothetical protein